MLLAEMAVGEKFATGGITAAIGICITFLVLAVLICLVILVTKFEKLDLKKVFRKLFQKNGKSVTEPEGTVLTESGDDKKLVAAITAAVAVALEAERAEDAPKASFRVKSIKRI